LRKRQIQRQNTLSNYAKTESGDMTVKAVKRKKLEANGWKVGSTADLLELSDEEAAYIELKLKLASHLKAARTRRHLTQREFARQIDSSQSRVAKMETGDRSVSLDLLIKSLLALGVTNEDIGKAITNSRCKAA
jgi:DNA-binding XRE family transcriptional regulator